MKKYLIVFIFFLLPTICSAYSFVQENSSRFNANGSINLGNPNSGDLIVVGFFDEASVTNASSVTDTDGDTFTKVVAITGANFYDEEIWYATGVAAGTADNISVNGLGTDKIDVSVAEYSGVTTLDTSNTTTSGANPSTLNLTTATNNELLYGFLVSGGVFPSSGTGFMGRSNTGSGFQAYYLPEDSNGAANTAGTNAVAYATGEGGEIAVAFKAGGGGGGGSIISKVIFFLFGNW